MSTLGLVPDHDPQYGARTAKGGSGEYSTKPRNCGGNNLIGSLANYLVCTSPQVLSLLFTHHTFTDLPSSFKGLAFQYQR